MLEQVTSLLVKGELKEWFGKNYHHDLIKYSDSPPFN